MGYYARLVIQTRKANSFHICERKKWNIKAERKMLLIKGWIVWNYNEKYEEFCFIFALTISWLLAFE